MIEIYFKSIRDEKFLKIDDFRIGSWIHVDEATVEDLEKISQITNLEKTDLHDSLDKYESPRIEQKDEKTIIFIRHPTGQEEGLRTTPIAIIISDHYIITISPQKSSLVDTVASSQAQLATTQKSKLLLYILLKITQEFTNKITKLNNDVIEQEREIKNVSNSSIIRLTKNEDTLNQYLSSLVPIKNLLETITAGRYIHLYEKDHDLLQDLLIAIKQSEDICRVNIKNIRSLRDSYQILFTNDVNKTIKFLTAITIIFTIPTIIASVYGMNLKLPIAEKSYAFILIVAIMLVLSLFVLWIFAKKKWL